MIIAGRSCHIIILLSNWHNLPPQTITDDYSDIWDECPCRCPHNPLLPSSQPSTQQWQVVTGDLSANGVTPHRRFLGRNRLWGLGWCIGFKGLGCHDFVKVRWRPRLQEAMELQTLREAWWPRHREALQTQREA
jgi:hypothetical protein